MVGNTGSDDQFSCVKRPPVQGKFLLFETAFLSVMGGLSRVGIFSELIPDSIILTSSGMWNKPSKIEQVVFIEVCQYLSYGWLM